MEDMYNHGFLAALVIGVVALLLPALWVAWWWIASLGETTNATHTASPHPAPTSRMRPAA